MTDATSGITLAFAGTFTALGTAAFRSAFTPLLRLADAAGNTRWLSDHLGLPMGRIATWEEKWDWVLTVSGAQALSLPAANYARWTYSSTANTGLNIGGNAVSGPSLGAYAQLTMGLSPVNGNQCRLSSPVFTGPGGTSAVSTAAEFEANGDASGTTASAAMKMGLSNLAAAVIGAGDYTVGFAKRSADTTWQCVASNNGTATYVDTGVSCLDASNHLFRVELHSASTAYGLQAIFFVDGKPFSISTNIPVAQSLGWVTSIDCVGAGLTTAHIQISGLRAAWNRLSNPVPGI
jgi:hypothetical protein